MDDLRIGKLQLAPGDVLVIKSDKPLTQEMMVRVHDHARKFVGADIRVLVLDPSLELSVLTKADIDARAG